MTFMDRLGMLPGLLILVALLIAHPRYPGLLLLGLSVGLFVSLFGALLGPMLRRRRSQAEAVEDEKRRQREADKILEDWAKK